MRAADAPNFYGVRVPSHSPQRAGFSVVTPIVCWRARGRKRTSAGRNMRQKNAIVSVLDLMLATC